MSTLINRPVMASALIATVLSLLAGDALAYVGPAAGISLLGAIFGILSTIFLAVAVAVLKPLRRVFWRKTVLVGLVSFIVAFGWGASAVYLQIFPYKQMRQVYSLANEIRVRRGTPWRGYKPARAQHLDPGVVFHQPELASPGLTYMARAQGDRYVVSLIDMNGTELATWHPDFDDIWPEPEHTLRGLFDPYIHGLAVRPDGGIVLVFDGMGAVSLSACSDLEWTVDRQTHHDVFIDEDGNIWIPAQKRGVAPGLLPDFQEDLILKLSPDGDILAEYSVMEILKTSQLEGLVSPVASGTPKTLGPEGLADLTHLNNIEIVSRAIAENSEIFEPGDVILSLRNPSAILAFRPASGEVIWHISGAVTSQHDPDLTPEGNLVVFDNRAIINRDSRGPIDGRSRLVELTPDNEIVWAYDGGESMPFAASIRGQIQLLPNGNRLVVVAGAGTVFEITRQGELAWVFNNVDGEGTRQFVTNAVRVPDSPLLREQLRCES